MPPVDVTDETKESQTNPPATGSDNQNSVNTEETAKSVDEENNLHHYTIEEGWDKIDEEFSGNVTQSEVEHMMTNITGGIFGMPYQFMHDVDLPPVNSAGKEISEFGSKYIQKIVSVMPVMFISPGEPAFMGDYSSKEREAVGQLYRDDAEGLSVDDVLSHKAQGKFYTFNSQFDKYCDYVNIQVRTLANLMGIAGKAYDGTHRFWDFDLHKVLNKDFHKLFNSQHSIAFYLDAETTISESFNNSTTESMLSSKVNQFSDIAREISFMGVTADSGMMEATQGIAGTVTEAVGSIGGSIPLVGGIINKLSYAVHSVVSGGKIVFPEIWSGSDYNRSYSIQMKLRTPDQDPISIMMNIYLPICCLTALTMPHQAGSDANGYLSPFLVRATYKSIFNCELGLITSLDIQKGGEDKWNGLGMPTTADVTVTIKDLYSTMFASRQPGGLINNNSQLDYLALMAGLDMNKDWLTRRKSLEIYLTAAQITRTIPNAWYKFKSGANKTALGFLSKLGVDTRYAG